MSLECPPRDPPKSLFDFDHNDPPHPIPGIKAFLILVTIVLIQQRIYLGYTTTPEPSTWVDVYKDIAHMFVAGLIVSYYYRRTAWLLGLAVALVVVEVVVAFITRVLL